MNTIAVAGAGLVGRMAALTLLRAGYRVTLYDKDKRDGEQSAAMAAGGLLTPLGEAPACSPWIVHMGFDSLERWPALLASLEQPVFFQRDGAIVVAHRQDHGDFQRFQYHLSTHWQDRNQYKLDREQLLELEPELGRGFEQGLYLPEEGQLSNRQLMDALRHQLEQEQVEWKHGHEVESVGNRSLIVKGKTLSFDLVIDCRGLGAANQQQDLRGVRGELFHLHAPEVNLRRPVRLMHPRYQLYIAPKPEQRYLIGATQIESDDRSPMTVRSALELLSAAYSVHPGFAEATIEQSVSQCRPAYTDNHPKITVSDGCISVNGLYRHGFLVTPTVIDHLMAVIDRIKDAPALDGAHFSRGLAYAQLIETGNPP